jgi:hypothetical protein
MPNTDPKKRRETVSRRDVIDEMKNAKNASYWWREQVGVSEMKLAMNSYGQFVMSKSERADGCIWLHLNPAFSSQTQGLDQ